VRRGETPPIPEAGIWARPGLSADTLARVPVREAAALMGLAAPK